MCQGERDLNSGIRKILNMAYVHRGCHTYMVGEDRSVLPAISSRVVFRMTQCIAVPSTCRYLAAALCMNRGYPVKCGAISMTLLLPETFWMESDITLKKWNCVSKKNRYFV